MQETPEAARGGIILAPATITLDVTTWSTTLYGLIFNTKKTDTLFIFICLTETAHYSCHLTTITGTGSHLIDIMAEASIIIRHTKPYEAWLMPENEIYSSRCCLSFYVYEKRRLL